MEKKFPFELSLPSDELEQRSKNIQNNENTELYKSAEKLFEDLGI
jgi:antitoxin component of RelBE/YafQ-DinJ toxin-antitoxin module